jgi:hypothetical protein
MIIARIIVAKIIVARIKNSDDYGFTTKVTGDAEWVT